MLEDEPYIRRGVAMRCAKPAFIGLACVLTACLTAQAANTRTWTGGGGADNNWMTAANWGGTAPVSGDDLHFAGTTGTATNNNFAAGTSFNSITFDPTAGSFTLGGNGLTLAGGTAALANTAASGTMTIGLNIAFSSSAPTVSCVAGGTLSVSGTIANGGLLITVNSAGTVNLNGAISGTGGLTANGAGTLVLASAGSAYTGTTTIDKGTLRCTADQSLTAATNGLTFGTTTGSANPGTLELSSANATFGGPLLVQTNSTTAANTIVIGSTKTLTINNTVTIGMNASATVKLTATGGGALVVNNSAPIGIRIGGSTNAGVYNTATLDLSGLGAFTASLNTAAGQFRVSNPNTNNVAGNLAYLYLPTASPGNATITAYTFNVGDNSSNGGTPGAANNFVVLGSGANTFNVVSFSIGSVNRDCGSVTFPAGAPSATFKLRTTDGSSAAAAFNMGTGAATSSIAGDNIFDVTGHTADIYVATLAIGNSARAVSQTNTFSMDTGTLNAATVQLGFRTGATVTAPGVVLTSNLNIGGSANVTIGSGGLEMGKSDATAATNTNYLYANLNVSGGSVTISNSATLAAAVKMSNNSGSAATNCASTFAVTGGTVTLAGHMLKGVATNPSNATLTLSGGTLDMSGNNIGGATTALMQTLNFQSGTLKNVAQINNGAGITKTTAGTLTMGGTNTYTGTTTVSAGTLLVTGTQSGSAVSLDGGTLRGTGAVGAISATANGGNVAPGLAAGKGTLSGGAGAVLGSGVNLTARIAGYTAAGSDYDQLKLLGALTTGGTSALTLDLSGLSTAGMAGGVVVYSGGVPATTFGTVTLVNNPSNYVATLMYTDAALDVDIGSASLHVIARGTKDTNGNGYIDAIRILTSAPLNDNFAGLQITVAGYTVVGYDTGSSANDNEFFVRLAEGGTPDTGATPGVQVVAGGNLGLPVDAAAVPAADKAKPVLMSASWYDGSGAGVDANDPIYLTFSEPVTSNNALAGDFNLPVAGDTCGAGATVSSGQNQTNPRIVTITLLGDPLLTPGGMYSPGALTPGSATGIFVADGTRIVDAAGNAALVQAVGTAVDLQPGTESISICWDDFTIAARTWGIGSANPGAICHAYAAFPPNGLIVCNNGNVGEKFSVSCSAVSSANWALATTAAQDQFEVKVDNGSAPYGNYALDLAAGPQDIVRHIYSGHNKPFDLQFTLPASVTTGAGVAQTVTVTITATKD